METILGSMIAHLIQFTILLHSPSSMRETPRIDRRCALLFGLSEREAAHARRLLARMGSSALGSLARMALEGPENAARAALWRALRAPHPWPWMGAELEREMALQGALEDGHELHCALLALPFEEPSAPGALLGAAESLGGRCESLGRSPSRLVELTPHGARHALRALALGAQAGAAPTESLAPGLRAWGFLARLPSTAPQGAFEEMLAQAASLDALGAGPPWALLGAGPLASILASAGALCAPLELRALLDSLSRSVMLHASDLACSVSAHSAPAPDGRVWLRVALRSSHGMLLGGLEWPAETLDQAFASLLRELARAGAQAPEIVEGRFGPELCEGCSEPLYPMPERPDWRAACRDAGLPEDGTHPGCG